MSKIVYDQILDIIVALSLFERVLRNCTVKHPVLKAKDEIKWPMKKKHEHPRKESQSAKCETSEKPGTKRYLEDKRTISHSI